MRPSVPVAVVQARGGDRDARRDRWRDRVFVANRAGVRGIGSEIADGGAATDAELAALVRRLLRA